MFVGGTFISYSHTDSDFVLRLYKRFVRDDIPVWLDRHDLVAGSIEYQITQGIRANDIVVLVLSDASLASDWVWDEIRTAREEEKSQDRHIICPIAIDDAWKSNPPDGRRYMDTIRERFVVPFGPDHDFENHFQKLLKGMKTNYEIGAR